jgi:hypothetical protein
MTKNYIVLYDALQEQHPEFMAEVGNRVTECLDLANHSYL